MNYVNVLRRQLTIEQSLSLGFQGLLLTFLLWHGEWSLLCVNLGFFLMQLFLIHKKSFPLAFSLLLLIAATVNAAGSENALALFDRISFYDKIDHGFAEFVITLFIGYVLKEIKELQQRKILFFLLILSVGIALGAIWEMFEWTFGVFVPPQPAVSAADTATDLMADSLGVFIAACLLLFNFY